MTRIKKARSGEVLDDVLPSTKCMKRLRSEVKRIADKEEGTMGDVIRTAVEEFVERYKKGEAKEQKSKQG